MVPVPSVRDYRAVLQSISILDPISGQQYAHSGGRRWPTRICVPATLLSGCQPLPDLSCLKGNPVDSGSHFHDLAAAQQLLLTGYSNTTNPLTTRPDFPTLLQRPQSLDISDAVSKSFKRSRHAGLDTPVISSTPQCPLYHPNFSLTCFSYFCWKIVGKILSLP